MKNIHPTPKVPLMLLGVPGIGKTHIIERRFEVVKKLLLSACVEEDIAGIPWRDGVIARRTKPDWLEDLDQASRDGKTTCLFLDEMDKARRAVADTLLTLIASRTVGEYQLPANTCIVAAANPEHAGAGPESMSQPMLSRFCIVRVEPNVEEWLAESRKRYQSPAAHAVIHAVERGEIPLYERHGEGYDLRTTCPRTLWLALDHLEEGTADERHVSGLLTAACASAFLLAANGVRDDVFDLSDAIVRKATNKTAHVFRA